MAGRRSGEHRCSSVPVLDLGVAESALNEKSDKPRVVYWDVGPNPYMTERFNAVASRGNLQLEAWFSNRVEPDRSWDVDEASWRFPYRFLLRVPGTRLRFAPPTWRLGRNRRDLIVSLFGDTTFVLGWATSWAMRIPTAFWSQVTFDSWSERRPWKEAVKRFMFSRADATFGGGPESQAFARRYGSRRALELRHAIDVDHYAQARSLPEEERKRAREELGLRGVTFVYVGRLWSGKGLSDLVAAFARLQELTEVETTLLIVGDGPEEDALRRRCRDEELPVVFAGFRQKPELPRLYAASDVFVFPTLGDPYGLVVDEAMAAALPVISTSAAGEIDLRIDDGVNGFVVPPNDPTALASSMKMLAEDDERRRRMGLLSIAKVEGRTPERWAEAFETHVFDILARGPRSRASVERWARGQA